MPNKHISDMQRRLETTIAKLENNIVMQLGGLDADAGRFTSTQVNLSKALAMREQLQKELVKVAGEMRKTSNGMNMVLDSVGRRLKVAKIPAEFSAAETSLLNVWKRDTLEEFNLLSRKTINQIGNDIYSGVLSQTPTDEVINQLRATLTGSVDRAGTPMVVHAKTIAATKFMEADAAVMLKRGKRAGVKRWKYFGTVIGETRPWCVSHQNKIFTEAEIQEWAGKSWAGKKSGNPFTVRGGWNCRHSWRPVVDEPE